MAVAAALLVAQRSHPLEVGWWRLAFILALPLGLVARFVRRRVSETSQFLAVQQSGHLIKHPIPTLWANDRLAMLRGFALIAAGSLAFNTFLRLHAKPPGGNQEAGSGRNVVDHCSDIGGNGGRGVGAGPAV
jgi:MHS family proline/betaine transporter-like MFS transporter